MSGFFGMVSDKDCVEKIYHGTDYHSHLGMAYGGIAVFDGKEILVETKEIKKSPYRAQLYDFVKNVKGNMGIGIISDYEEQPIYIKSRLGDFAIAHVGRINNLEKLIDKAYREKSFFLTNKINPLQILAYLINQGKDFVEGIKILQDSIEGSSSLMILTKEGIYLARDKFGRTPITIAKKDKEIAAAFETCSFLNTIGIDYETYFLEPGEIGIINREGYIQLEKPKNISKLCTFLFIYYGFPASCYNNINIENVRNNLGKYLAIRDEKEIREGKLKIDYVAGIPDSGIGCGIGYANKAGLPFCWPYKKYTPSWDRSFIPQEQKDRDLIAKMKLLPIRELIEGKRILLTDDSIVRGTQLRGKIEDLFSYGAKEIHLRVSCPPIINTCKYLNFSISRQNYELAAIRAIRKIEGEERNVEQYMDERSDKYEAMVDIIKKEIGATSLKYQFFGDMIKAIGIPEQHLCVECWKF